MRQRLQQLQQQIKQPKVQLSLVAAIGILSLAAGGGVAWMKLTERQSNLPFATQLPQPLGAKQSPAIASAVASLATLSPEQRAETLEDLAKSGKARDRSHAKYLLASDLIKQKRSQEALNWLDGLEKEDPVLAGHILLKRARAYGDSGNAAQAQATLQALVQRYPKHPATAEAFYWLGKGNPTYWDRAIAEFPSHPRTLEIAQQRLQQNPDARSLLVLLVKHGSHLAGIGSVAERLSQDYAAQLQPEDWQAIGDIYWQEWDYGKAGKAYAKATRTPRNAYRQARGLQLGGKRSAAKAGYQALAKEFPQAEETATALIRLGKMNQSAEGLAYLDRAIAAFPDRAADALLAKADIFEKLNSKASATQARQSVLNQYPNSDAAAEYRWETAQSLAKSGSLESAQAWAKPILQNNPESELAPEAGFWVGKWALQSGQTAQAKSSFEHVLANHPESYYAWRSATMLGLPVGDFTSIRQLAPQVTIPPNREALPAGSEMLQALHQLGQDREAWAAWKVEFDNNTEPSVAEQFTDGIVRLAVGDRLDGIAQISNLEWRDDPVEKQQHQQLKQKSAYWKALYPFPFSADITKWSRERQLNPMLVTALIRQESRFEVAIQSFAGATGLMQVMPSTGAWIAEKIDLTDYSLNNPTHNINLGTWYLDYTHQEYNNNSLLALASYNAGPGNVSKWLREKGFNDPDAFVESIPFDETKGYVKAVFENYWNYMRLYNPETSQLVAQYAKRANR